MLVEYELTLEDAAAIQRYGQQRRAEPPIRAWVWAALWVWFAAWFPLKAYDLYQEGHALLAAGHVLAVAGVLATSAVLLHRAGSPQVLARKMYAQDPGLFRKTTVVLGPEGLAYDAPPRREVRPWRAFTSIERTADHAFFFTAPARAYFVPRHAFPDEHAFAVFVETARRYFTHGQL